MHGKEAAIANVLLERLGLVVTVARDIDTDALGTFTGEIPRAGSIRDAAIAKAKLGIAATGLPIGIASEGSYGPHPHLPFVAGGIELLVMVDERRGIMVCEYLVEDAPMFDHVFAGPDDALGPFLDRIDYPAHALIVKPAGAGPGAAPIYKGLRDRDSLTSAIRDCAARSTDGRALIQTDMRAHMNPTRMATIGRLAHSFADRIATPCPICALPGYGQTGVETGLPCRACGAPSVLVRHQLYGCTGCDHRDRRPRPDGRRHADPSHCPECNP